MKLYDLIELLSRDGSNTKAQVLSMLKTTNIKELEELDRSIWARIREIASGETKISEDPSVLALATKGEISQRLKNNLFRYYLNTTKNKDFEILRLSYFSNVSLVDLINSKGFGHTSLEEYLEIMGKYNFIVLEQSSAKNLTEKEQYVVKMRSEGYTLERIGADLNLTRERIRQIQNAAYKKLAYNTEVERVNQANLEETINDAWHTKKRNQREYRRKYRK